MDHEFRNIAINSDFSSKMKTLVISKDAHAKIETIRKNMGKRSYKATIEQLIEDQHQKILNGYIAQKNFQKNFQKNEIPESDLKI